MNNKIIVVAGATGNLGFRITKALLEKEATVKALVRINSDKEKIDQLRQLGAGIIEVDMSHVNEVSTACAGASCVVSALAGLREVIIDTQSVLLKGAIAAGVPRFIPSDYSLDFTKFKEGENRNLDWRREFHKVLDSSPIAATSIFNGAFMDMLTNEIPMIIPKNKLVLYWGNADHKMGFTTIQNTAEFTANVALENKTPRYLHIAGDQISPKQVRATMNELTGQKFRLLRTGGLGLLGVLIKITKLFSPSKNDLYPAWQGMQYMKNMMDTRANLPAVNNNLFPSIKWTSVKTLIAASKLM